MASHGGQSEIVLRVKQADNPFFNFLMPENDLHPYFRFLVENPHLTEEVKKEEKNEKVEESKPKNDAISLLGEVYGDVDDEEDVGGKDKEKDKNAPIEDSLEAGISPEEPPEEVKMAITKLVEFVSRNGKQFEEVVKEKDKEEGRFPFIIEGHKWFPFYSQKLNSALSQVLFPSSYFFSILFLAQFHLTLKIIPDKADSQAKSTMEKKLYSWRFFK